MLRALIALAPLLAATGCATAPLRTEAAEKPFAPTPTKFQAKSAKREVAYFAGGCFWGLEYRFRQVSGVTATAVGYEGGHTKSPTYEDVCSHTTGHAETTMVEFDPESTSYRKLATLFFTDFHNPTTLNRQGPDEGDSYRSVAFYTNSEQKRILQQVIAETQKGLKEKIVTEVTEHKTFWPAETYHQNYITKTGHFLCPIEPPVKIG